MRRTIVVIVITALCLAAAGGAHAKKGFSGVVEVLPPGGYVGQWVISGVPVLVTPETRLKFRHWPPYVGAPVKVNVVARQGGYLARKIKERTPKKKW